MSLNSRTCRKRVRTVRYTPMGMAMKSMISHSLSPIA